MKIKTLFYVLPHVGKIFYAVRGMRSQEVASTRAHLELCAKWLLHIQEPAGGYAASFSFITGLRHAYIETTGYIIPTMLDLAGALEEPRYRASALRAGEWLLTVQHVSGAFTDVDGYQPQVFDTGQVLLGLNRLYRETEDVRYREAARRAADWLVSVQDADGSWATAAYHTGQPATYHTRVAAALLDTAQLTGDQRHRAGGNHLLRWAASRQQPNGFFLNAELKPGVDPVLHTMVYVLEGFWMAYQVTGDPEWLAVLLRGALPLRKVQLERDQVPRSQYNGQWEVTNPEKCIPGLAQWAGLCLGLREITREPEWLSAAQLAIYYLKSKQLRGSGVLQGALPASVPLWGYYHPLMLPNWAVKFFADALLLYERHGLAVWQEQEAWVAKCFALRLDGGKWERQSQRLEPVDELICASISQALTPLPTNASVLDLGCGEGRYLQHFQAQFPHLKFLGVDPGAANTEGQIRNGSACLIPLPDQSVDAVYTWIALQHVADLPRALLEVRRVLKPGGVLVVGDRNKFSGRGLAKPWHEIKGRWMYAWDSPFRERWYFAGEWKQALARAGYQVTGCERVANPGARGWRRWLGVNRFLVLTARKP